MFTAPCNEKNVTSNSIPKIMISLTNENVKLIYSLTICEQTVHGQGPSNVNWSTSLPRRRS